MILRGEHCVQHVPGSVGGVEHSQLPDDVLHHGGEQCDEDCIVLLVTSKKHWVWHGASGSVSVQSDGFHSMGMVMSTQPKKQCEPSGQG